MKHKTNKTISKRLRRRPSGLVERSVVGHQHLRGRKSRRQKQSAGGRAAVAPADLRLSR